MGLMDAIDQDKVVKWLESLIDAGFETSFEHDTGESADGTVSKVEFGAFSVKTGYAPSTLTIELPKANLRITVSVEQV